MRGEGQGGAKGLEKEARTGQQSPFLWGQSQNRREGPRAAQGPPSHQGPRQDTDEGLYLRGLSPQLALQVLRDQVGLVMLGEMVTPHEALLTLGTLEAFVPWEDKMHVTRSGDKGARVRYEGHPVKLAPPCHPALPKSCFHIRSLWSTHLNPLAVLISFLPV